MRVSIIDQRQKFLFNIWSQMTNPINTYSRRTPTVGIWGWVILPASFQLSKSWLADSQIRWNGAKFIRFDPSRMMHGWRRCGLITKPPFVPVPMNEVFPGQAAYWLYLAEYEKSKLRRAPVYTNQPGSRRFAWFRRWSVQNWLMTEKRKYG